MENVRERVNLDIIPHTNIDQIIKRQSKLSFKGINMHYSTISLYRFDKEKIVFDKPIYLGFSVLELSKMLICELDNFVALRSKSYSFSYGATQKTVQKATQKSKQKGKQHTPPHTQFTNSLFNSETTTNYSIRSDAHNLTVQKQDKLALNPFLLMIKDCT